MFDSKILDEIFDSDNDSPARNIFSKRFFYPNLCQVCRCHDKKSRLIECSKCEMIFYCSKDHQAQHWPIHKEFCKEATELRKCFIGLSFFHILSKLGKDEQWEWKMIIINLMESQLKRKLVQFEKEMILYPKICMICHEADINLLTSCSECPHVNFCKKHEEIESHETRCLLYKFCCTLDAYSIVSTPLDMSKFIKDIAFYKDNDVLKCMSGVMSRFEIDNVLETYSYDVFIAHGSDFFSPPLTLFYALQKLNCFQSQIIVHVIGLTELKNSSSWESILHLISKLKVLKVIFIGPNCSSTNFQHKVCQVCKSKGKSLHIESYSERYKNYYKSNWFIKPNIILGISIDLDADKMWKESFLAVDDLKCPLVLANSAEIEIENNHRRISHILNKSISYIFKGINPFGSLYPRRGPGAEDFLYNNNYIVIYNQYCDPSSNHGQI